MPRMARCGWMRLAAYLRLWALYSPGSHCSQIVELVKTIRSLVSKLDHMMLIWECHGDSCGVAWGLNIRAYSTVPSKRSSVVALRRTMMLYGTYLPNGCLPK